MMEITGFNEVTVNGKKHNLYDSRLEIIKKECKIIHFIVYNGCSFVVDISSAISNHLSQLRFEVVDNKIKLGSIEVGLPYHAFNKCFTGSIENIKRQVTEHLEKMDVRLTPGSGVWLDDNYVISQPDDTISETKARLIANEMRKIDETHI